MIAGTYYSTFSSAAMGTTSGNKPQMECKFNVTHVEDGTDSTGWQPLDRPLERTLYLYFSEKAWKHTERKLESLGFQGEFADPQFSQFGQGVQLALKYEMYNGQEREKWELASFGGGVQSEPPAQDELRRLNATWKQNHKSVAAKPVAVAAAPSPASVTTVRTKVDPVTGEDIPF